MKKTNVFLIVLGLFSLVMITFGSTFAFFRYSKQGETENTLKTGKIFFSYTEGQTIEIVNAFPVSDQVGASDTHVYTFTVNGSTPGSGSLLYDVTLLSDNTNPSEKYFRNDQIKINLVNVTSNHYSVGSNNSGVLLSNLNPAKNTNLFTTDGTSGSCTVIANQTAVKSGEIYNLRIWIADTVNYSTEDGQGKYNGYKYSLKVKVDAEGTTN